MGELTRRMATLLVVDDRGGLHTQAQMLFRSILYSLSPPAYQHRGLLHASTSGVAYGVNRINLSLLSGRRWLKYLSIRYSRKRTGHCSVHYSTRSLGYPAV